MSPEHKDILDIMLKFLGPAGMGGVFMAYLGWARARKEAAQKMRAALEETPPAPPAAAVSPVAQLGGLVLSHQTLQDLIGALNKLAESHSDKTEVCRMINSQRIEEGIRNRQHEGEMLGKFGTIMFDLTNALRGIKH